LEFVLDHDKLVLSSSDALRFDSFEVETNQGIMLAKHGLKETVLSYDSRSIYVAKLVKKFINLVKYEKGVAPNFQEGLRNMRLIQKVLESHRLCNDVQV